VPKFFRISVRGEDGPVPWYARVFMVSVCVAFACVSTGAFWSLGHRTARSYFGFLPPGEKAVAGAAEEPPPNQALQHTDRA